MDSSDETKFLPGRRLAADDAAPSAAKPESDPFAFGDSTIFQLRNQDFTPSDPVAPKVAAEPAVAPAFPGAPEPTLPPPPSFEGGNDEFGTVVQRPISLETQAAQIETPAV